MLVGYNFWSLQVAFREFEVTQVTQVRSKVCAAGRVEESEGITVLIQLQCRYITEVRIRRAGRIRYDKD